MKCVTTTTTNAVSNVGLKTNILPLYTSQLIPVSSPATLKATVVLVIKEIANKRKAVAMRSLRNLVEQA